MQKLLTIISLIFIISAVQTAIAQPQKNFAQRRGLEIRQELAEAESLAVKLKMPLRATLEDGAGVAVHRVQNGLLIYRITDNINAAKTISTNKVWPTGGNGLALTGEGIILGEWDEGAPRSTHKELTGRILKTQGSNSDHSTHVAGTMIGTGLSANAKGMSYLGSLKAFNWDYDVTEMDTAGVLVSNHSYGAITGWRYGYPNAGAWNWWGDVTISTFEDYRFGFYDADARDFDQISINNPYYLICKSAGNDRDEGSSYQTTHYVRKNGVWVIETATRSRDGNDGYDCIGDAGVAKNILTVGAVEDITGGYNNPSGVVMSSFSCWGPADDGRIKPDIVANGVGLYSTLRATDSAYGSMSGTSMATPNASGSIGLLLHHQQRLHGSTLLRSSTMKAIILNTADEAGPNPGPDYMNGWGLMNTLKAAQLMTQDSIDGANSHIRELLLSQGDTIRFNILSDGTSPIRASICWTDPAGTPVAPALDPTNIMLKNDLDLRITKPRDNNVYNPWILNPTSPTAAATTGDNIRDNTEQISISPTERSVYTVQITNKGTLTGGSQYVSFVVSGNGKNLGPVFASYGSSYGYTMIPDSVVHDSVKIKNLGDSLLILKLSVPLVDQGWLVLEDDSIAIASLDSGYIKFEIQPNSLDTWTEYNSTITIEHNDSTTTPDIVTVNLNTLGSTAHKSISQHTYGIDLGEIVEDSFYIWNTGHIPLTFSIADTGKNLPNWLVIDPVDGSILPGDSLKVHLTLNEVDLPRDNYYSTVVIEHNDTQTESYTIPVSLYVGTQKIVSTDVTDFWNIVSLPVIAIDNRKTSLYPSALSNAWAYDGSYKAKDSLYPGSGYWLKFAAPETFPMTGYVFSSETLYVTSGWQMIGVLSSTILANTVTTEPPDLIISNFFGFDHGYEFADTLYAGKGYWVKTNDAGKIILSGSMPPPAKTLALDQLSDFNSLTFSDEAGNKQTLYFSVGKKPTRDISFYKLPPPAPEGSFDVRFASGSMLEVLDKNSSQTINIQSLSGYVVVNASLEQHNGPSIAFVDDAGRQYLFDENNHIVLNGVKSISVLNKGIEIPTEYSLDQNYPNPFNPTTIVSFDLPVDNFVTLKVYNALGQEVATLVNGYKEAGKYSFDFDASNLPSGTYIYKMTADKFSEVKKMVLMR
ncbi:MAG: S8 family serine peptidase [Ignavibacteriales bacterium]|nr:S8 family serine peptidase [Ignavibacteriales bacterium]